MVEPFVSNVAAYGSSGALYPQLLHPAGTAKITALLVNIGLDTTTGNGLNLSGDREGQIFFVAALTMAYLNGCVLLCCTKAASVINALSAFGITPALEA
ncbi:MAG: hypothetical protein H7240_00730 [Glaciimonas sp.]|nr:hypothetical protein [Glaciimonas sp.]